MVASGVYMDPPTAAAFTVERVELLTPRETHAIAEVLAHGVLIAVRNDHRRPRRFRAEITEVRDVGEMEDELGRVVERDWAAAYDRARRARGG
jgi:hypothetical protein